MKTPLSWIKDYVTVPEDVTTEELTARLVERTIEVAREVLAARGTDPSELTEVVLVGELLTYRIPVVVALNMVDLAQKRGLTIDAGKLGRRLGCPVVAIVARRGDGVDEVRQALSRALAGAAGSTLPGDLPSEGSSIEARIMGLRMRSR